MRTIKDILFEKIKDNCKLLVEAATSEEEIIRSCTSSYACCINVLCHTTLELKENGHIEKNPSLAEDIRKIAEPVQKLADDKSNEDDSCWEAINEINDLIKSLSR